MACGLHDNDGHEDHFCHRCEYVSLLGSRVQNRPCKICLELGNCKFERDDKI